MPYELAWLAGGCAGAATVCGPAGSARGRLLALVAHGNAPGASRRVNAALQLARRVTRPWHDMGARRADADEAWVGEVVSAFAVHLACGAAPAEALSRSVDDLADGTGARELSRAVEMVRLGSPGPAALMSAAGRYPGLRWLATSWRVTESTGAPLSPVAARLGEAIRAEAQHERFVRAELAGVRASARLLGTLPLVGLLMGGALGAQPLGFLLSSDAGRCCLLAGLLLEWAGLRWSAAVARAARAAS